MPAQRSSLLGRDREIETVCALLERDDVSLVTLTGPGGIGKTQLAIAIATRVRERFPGGAWFVDLSPLRDPGLVLPTIAQAIGLPEVAGVAPRDQLRAYLADRRALLVLDNVEQVAAAAPDLADLLASCPLLSVLATSRAPLRISMERRYPTPPLPIPETTAQASVELARESAAVQLFVRSAQAVQPEFALTGENAETIAAICSRLNGLPLAIELAAARSNVLSPEALLTRLDHALPLLAGGPIDAPPRLQSLRDAIAWSYDLLDDTERRLFRRLAIFAGGFSEAAAAHVGHEDQDTRPMLARLASLVECNLLNVSGQGTEPRFTMLATIREFGVAELAHHRELDLAQERRSRWLLDSVERPNPFWNSGHFQRWRDALEPEIENLRASLEWLANQADHNAYVRLASRLYRLFLFCGRWDLCATLLRPAQEWSKGQETRERLDVLIGSGQTLVWMGDEAAAIPFFTEALSLGPGIPAGSRFDCLTGLALAANIQGDFNRATELQALAVAALDDVADADPNAIDEGRSVVALNQGFVEIMRGDIDRADVLATEALRIQRGVGFESPLPITLKLAADVAIARGDATNANDLIQESLILADKHRDLQHLAGVFTLLAEAELNSGNSHRAAQLLGAVDRLRMTLGGYPTDRLPIIERIAHDVRAHIGDRAFTGAWERGRTLPLDDAIHLARQVEIRGPSPAPASAAATLGVSPREYEVLCLLASGRTDREIADALYLSRRTVNTHVSHLLSKLGVANRRAAIAFARDQDLLTACPTLSTRP